MIAIPKLIASRCYIILAMMLICLPLFANAYTYLGCWHFEDEYYTETTIPPKCYSPFSAPSPYGCFQWFTGQADNAGECEQLCASTAFPGLFGMSRSACFCQATQTTDFTPAASNSSCNLQTTEGGGNGGTSSGPTTYQYISAYQATSPPATQPPLTQPPVTQPPVTQPPVTQPPATQPPVTQPPATQPPVTQPSTTAAPSTLPVTTSAPTTQTVATTSAPTTSKPTTAKPTTSKPTTAKPTTVKPTTAKPTTVKPTTVQPTTAPATITYLGCWLMGSYTSGSFICYGPFTYQSGGNCGFASESVANTPAQCAAICASSQFPGLFGLSDNYCYCAVTANTTFVPAASNSSCVLSTANGAGDGGTTTPSENMENIYASAYQVSSAATSPPSTSKPTTAKPTSKPTTVKPTTLPTTAKPTTVKPTTVKPTSNPTTVKPTTMKPSTAAPTIGTTCAAGQAKCYGVCYNTSTQRCCVNHSVASIYTTC